MRVIMSKKKSKSHASQRFLPGALEFREIFFTNLLLLGIEPLDLERRHAIPFNRDMFVLPNKKGFEVVMHFLFERLNPVMAHESFRDCWPICDKKQEQSFRRTISNQLAEISAEDPLANLPRIVPSLFMSPGGDRFYTLLLHFSQYVLLKVIKQENGKREREILQRPKLLPPVSHLGHIMLKTIQAASIRRRKRFMDKCQFMVLLQSEWKLFANELVKEHRSLSKQVRDLEHDIGDCLAASYDQARGRGSPITMRRRSGKMTSGEQQMHAVKRTQKVQKIGELWSAVDAFHVAHAAEREVVISILQAAENKYQLDAGQIDVRVPEMLLRECQEEIHRHNIGNTYEGGKLSLVTLIRLWNLSLHLYLEKIHQAPLPRFENLSSDVITRIHTHHAHFSNTKAMRSTLTNELLPMLKESVSCLHEQVTEGKTPSRKDSHRSFYMKSLGLELLPPTPPVSFEPASGSQNETPTRLPKLQTDTPDAVSVLSDTINKAALRHAGLMQGTPVSSLGELREQSHGHSRLPIPTSFSHTDTMPNHKRVKSAPSKVVPATLSIQSYSRHPDIKTCDPKLPFDGSQLMGTMNGDMYELPIMAKTQPRKETESHLRKHSKEGRKQQRLVEKQGIRKKSSKTKKPADAMPVSLSRTPVTVPRMDHISSPLRPKTGLRAHQILAEQIADAVTQGGKITPDVLESLITHSQESSPVDFAFPNPLASLDQDAFISQDKLKRTPEERSLDVSKLMDSTHETIPMRTPLESHSSPNQQTGQIQFIPSFDGNSFLLNNSLEDNNLSNEGHLSGVPVGNLFDKEQQSDQEGTQNHIGKTEISLETFDHKRLATLGDDSPILKAKSDFSEDLEQTLAEIFQTRTPQMSIKSKTRIADQKLAIFIEEDETFEPPLLPHRDTDFLEGLTPDLNLIRQERVKRKKENSQFLPVREHGKISQVQRACTSVDRVRHLSGGSHKTVTFSDHIDEHSFLNQDLSSIDQYYGEIQLKDELTKPADKPEQAGQSMSLEVRSPSHALCSRGVESPGKDAETFLSDIYLAHSPTSGKLCENLFTSPLENQLLSDSDLGQELSMNLSTAIDELLVPISPEVSPSRTPNLASCKPSLSSPNPSNQKKIPDFIVPGDESNLFTEFVPYHSDDLIGLPSGSSFIQGISNLRLSGIKETKPTPSHKTIQMPMNFDLSDEDDSILLPPSPVLSDKGSLST